MEPQFLRLFALLCGNLELGKVANPLFCKAERLHSISYSGDV